MEDETHCEPMPGRLMDGGAYFEVHPSLEEQSLDEERLGEEDWMVTII